MLTLTLKQQKQQKNLNLLFTIFHTFLYIEEPLIHSCESICIFHKVINEGRLREVKTKTEVSSMP